MKQFETFGKYLLLERLAAGGMAEVYLAKSNGAGGVAKFVAIKRILPQYSENQQFLDMFTEEAKIAVNLSHANVVSIYEFGKENRQFYLVMDLVEGQNLRQILNHFKKESKDFTIDQIVYIVKQVAAGLDHAHRCLDKSTGRPLNITHRDMSPQNIMISFEGEVKIVDFGIAKAESQMENTQAGTIKGKFGYMSPEQAEGLSVDSRTDIFSLGIILWELLAKDRLFSATSEAATLRKIRECQIPSLRRINPAIPAELERICNKSLAKDLPMRYQSAADFHRDLNRFLNTQYPDYSPQDFSKFMKETFYTMWNEVRNKHIEYAKAQAPALKDHTVVTTTQTATNRPDSSEDLGTGASISIAEVMKLFDSTEQEEQKLAIDVKSEPHVKLSDLRATEGHGSRIGMKKPTSFNAGHTSLTPGPGTNTQIRRSPYATRPNYQPEKSPNYILWAAIAIIPLIGGFLLFKKSNRVNEELPPIAAVVQPTPAPAEVKAPVPIEAQATPTPELTRGDINLASTQPVPIYTVTIESVPKVARLYVDGRDTGVFTPIRRQFEGNREVRIGLAVDGFEYYEKIEKFTRNGTSLKVTLQPLPAMGYVSIDSPNGGLDPIVYINNQRINQKLPIHLYGIPANKPTKIKITNPFAQASGETTVTVGVSQKMEVKIPLSPNKNR